MDSLTKKLLGDGPYPFSLNDLKSGQPIEAYIGSKMILLINKAPIDLPAGSHAHGSFEFLIPHTPMPYSKVEKKPFAFEKGKLFPFNDWQLHGPSHAYADCRMTGFQIDREFMQETCRLIYGRKGIAFINENYSYDPAILSLMKLFMEEVKGQQAGYEFILQHLCSQFAIYMLRSLKSNMPVQPTERNYMEKQNINRAIAYLREQYNKDYSLDELAQVANLSPYHFIRVFKAQTGKTPYDYLLDIKIEKALLLLKSRNCSVTEACFLCGFNNLEHFASVFKRKVGVLPSQYRKSVL